MVRVSNTILGIFNCITLLLGLAVLGTGLYVFASGGNTLCQKGLQNPLMILGAAISLVSLLGLIGSCFRVNFVLMIYLIVMFFLILGLICFTIFTILVTNEGVGKAASRTKIMDFQNWLKNQFVDGKNWNEIQQCFNEGKLCKNLGDKKNLTPAESGCCQPPVSCGFVPKNATFWDRPKMEATTKDMDCKLWSNVQETLCFNCETCKTGFVDTLRKLWGELAIFNVCFTVYAIFVYSVGCSARRSNKKYGSYTRYRGYA